MSDFPRSLIAFQRRFADEAACVGYLMAQRWPDGFRCPACGHDRAWALKCKPRSFECARCHRQTSVTAGTVMHGSKLRLQVWFWAAYLMATHSNGISARQLQAQLGLGSYKSAWLLCAKLRRAMQSHDDLRSVMASTIRLWALSEQRGVGAAGARSCRFAGFQS